MLAMYAPGIQAKQSMKINNVDTDRSSHPANVLVSRLKPLENNRFKFKIGILFKNI